MSLPPNVTSFVDRHGKERFRFRKTGHPTYSFKHHPGTAKNPSEEYQALIAGRLAETRPERWAPGTLGDLVNRFYASGDFNGGGERTRQKNRAILDDFRTKHGAKRVARIGFQHIEAMVVAKARIGKDERGRKIGGPFAAERFRKLLRRLFALAVKLEWITVNPVDHADVPKTPKTTGFHTWTDEEIEQYRAAHPVGTKARMALELLRWTMQRGGDARTFQTTQRRNGEIQVWNEKNQKFTWVPEPKQLTAAIQALPMIGAKTLLVTQYGKPFSEKGFGNWFKKQCVAAGLPHCTAHGVRKSTARQLAEHAEATQQQLKAAGGWSGDREVSTYTADANQKKMASDTLTRLAAWDLANHGRQVSQDKEPST